MANSEKTVPALTWTPGKHLLPVWTGDTVYDETVMFVGKTASAGLIYAPDEIICVRDYRLSVTYVEGKDYRIEGNRIYRLDGSAIPYIEPDEYFAVTPNNPDIRIAVNPEKVEFDFDPAVPRYLYYGEGVLTTDRQITVTYRHSGRFAGPIPPDMSARADKLLRKLREGRDVRMMTYGDSVAVGCCASGTVYGNNINPFTPDFPHIVAAWTEQRFGVRVTQENQAVGGWQTSDCLREWDARIAGKPIDLLLFRIGGNDGWNTPDIYEERMREMLTRFFADNPDGTVVLQSAETPNPQTTWAGNQPAFETRLKKLADEFMPAGVVVAPVCSMFEWLDQNGKRMRNMLGNNINHPNDFGIRLYAQIILKSLYGPLFDPTA